MYIFMKVFFSRQIYLYDFYIFKLNNLKVIHDLYSQCLTQALSKTTLFISTEGVYFLFPREPYSPYPKVRRSMI